MAEYSGRGDFGGTAYKAGGDKFTLDRYASVTPNYSQWQQLTTGRYDIDNCRANINYSGGKYWGDANLASGYNYQLHQGWSYNWINTGANINDGVANLSQSGWIWCNAWSATETWHGGGDFTVDLSRDNSKNVYFSFGTRRSVPPFANGNGAHPSWVITITFERCPKRYVLKDPNITTRTSNRIGGSVQYDADGITPTRIDSRLQKVQSSYSYGNDVVGGWHGQGDHTWFDYTGLDANTQYELHSHVVNSDYNDTPSNGNQEGTIVRTTRHWTLPIVGGCDLTVSMASSTSFSWSVTSTGSWTCTSKNYRIRYRRKGTSSWTTLGFGTSTSGTVSSLTAGKIYEVQAQPRAVGGGGDNVDGSWTGTKEVQLGILWTVTGITCGSREKTALKTISCTGKDGIPGITGYQFRIRQDGTSSWTTSSALTTNSWDKTGLKTNTKYEVQARLKNDVGWSNWSSSYYFCTKPSAGTSSVSCVRNNTTNSLNIKVSQGGTYSPASDTYQVRYRKSGTTTWTESSTSTNLTITISSLTAADTYEIQGRSRTKVGVDGSSTDWSAWSNSISVKVVRKAIIETLEMNTTGNATQVEFRISYKSDYPAANRIYYAITPASIANPGRQSGKYFSITGSPATITISKDYQGNNLLPNTKYKVWIYVNQYKAANDWYTAGLDLDSAVESLSFATPPNVGTLKDIKCVRNNTYNSLTFTATKNGTWSNYAGWEYRYKKSSDTEYNKWSSADPNNKTITGLDQGVSYDIQIRGSTSSSADIMVYKSQIYQLTIKVVRKPKITLELVRLKENEIGIKGVITDKGYPEVTSLDWQYSSNSFINLTYVPNTWTNFKTITFGANINTNQNVIYTNLYHFAMYSIRAKLTQYKTGAQWYTAGINNSFNFDINDIELAMYNTRTSRMKANNSGWKQVKDLRGWNGSIWKTTGTNIEPTSAIDSKQIWAKLNYQNDIIIANFYKNGDSQGNNQELVNKFGVWIPGIDRARWKGKINSDHAYGGNLFDNKLELNLATIQKSDIDHKLPYITIDSSKFEYKFNKDTISCKLKNNLANPTSLDSIFSIKGLSRVLPLKLIDTVYIELCTNIIPSGNDEALTLIPHLKCISKENPNSNRGLIVYSRTVKGNKFSKQLLAFPVSIVENLGLGYSFDSIECFNDFRTNNSVDNSTIAIKNKGSIVNVSNLRIYYTLM